ncbi:FecR family protein [Fodinibius roseus]|uniref:FecR family protein n=1 Tax=Fodinibius roseus TaxID=1194090 RepID=A0A1M5DSJ9_9BACT|nr:FecR domain-containing protein [Fodinibius roseus]SHF69930.1 FecR family protein [Fodinibius roseus]
MSENPNLEDLLTSVSFVRWIRDEGNPTENSYWNNWVEKDPQHHELVEEAKLLLTTEKHQLDSGDIEDELGKLRNKISWDKKEDRAVLGANISPRFSKRSWMVAASILLVLAILSGGFYMNYHEETSRQESVAEAAPVQEFRTDFGKKKTLRLKDGSEIVLNSNSQLRYNPNIKRGEDIEVWLQGEAYFDITHYGNENQRFFTVHTRDGAVQVLGTKFAVNSFGEETQTVLSEGKVKVRAKNDLQGHKVEQILKPGDLARFGRSRKTIALQEVNPLVYTSWTDDKLVFEKTPVTEVSTRIENTFGVKIKITDESLRRRRLSGSIRIPNLEVLKEALAKLLDAEVRQQGQVLHIEPKSESVKLD